jgi:hypothetical protein
MDKKKIKVKGTFTSKKQMHRKFNIFARNRPTTSASGRIKEIPEEYLVQNCYETRNRPKK